MSDQHIINKMLLQIIRLIISGEIAQSRSGRSHELLMKLVYELEDYVEDDND